MPNCSNQATIHGTKEQILELVGAYERGGDRELSTNLEILTSNEVVG